MHAVANLCRLLRDEVNETLQRERSGAEPEPIFTTLAEDWREYLFPGLSDADFADAYAQTVTFALLLARVDGISFEGIGLRLTWDHDHDYDPLLCEIAEARDAMLEAEARMRLLIAYGREFTRPRPYRLEDLARAAGMSISGIRTAYDNDEIAEVARLTGGRPARRPAEAQ